MTNDTYTICYHEPIDSAACRLLSAGAFRLLFDWQRLWMARTCNGRNAVEALPFSWASCRWPVKRQTWGRYRKELIEKGFLEAVSVNAALYRPSTRWRSYVPEPSEQESLSRHRAQTERRAQRTAAFRRDQKGDGARVRCVPEEATRQRPQMDHEAGPPQRPLNNTGNTPSTTPPCQSPVERGGGMIDMGDLAERFQRMARYAIPDDQAAMMDRATAEMDRRQRMAQMDGVARRAALNRRRADRLHAAWAKLDEGARRTRGPGAIAACLGDKSERAVQHVRAVMERRGPDAVFAGAVSILEDPGDLRSYVAALEARASAA